jgi:predicted O-methyltransferase YrrM
MVTTMGVLRRFREAAQHPRGGVARFARDQLVRRGRSPLQLGLPWVSYPAIDLMTTLLRPGMTVFEFGSGGSTVWFGQLGARVVSVEDQPVWCHAVRAQAQSLGLDGMVDVRLLTADTSSPAAFAASPYLTSFPSGPADLVLVDGVEDEAFSLRPVAFGVAERAIRPGGAILVDDCWRYPQLRGRSQAREIVDLPGFGPGRNNLTWTQAHLY